MANKFEENIAGINYISNLADLHYEGVTQKK